MPLNARIFPEYKAEDGASLKLLLHLDYSTRKARLIPLFFSIFLDTQGVSFYAPLLEELHVK
jgi:hypothetical protein